MASEVVVGWELVGEEDKMRSRREFARRRGRLDTVILDILSVLCIL
jgi:hypothetical protein